MARRTRITGQVEGHLGKIDPRALPTGDGQFEDIGTVLANSQGTNVPSSGTAHVKGPYVELVASTAFDARNILLTFRSSISVADSLIVDLAVGAAGSEVDIIPNVLLDRFDTSMELAIVFPVFVSAGSRVSARCQADAADAGEDMYISAILMGSSFFPLSPLPTIKDYGVILTTTRGTTVDPGATADTKGAFVELSASIDKDIRAFVLVRGQKTNSALTSADFLYDIAIGAAGSEQVIVPNIFFVSSSGPDLMSPVSIGPIPLQIPAGSRLSIRGQSSTTQPTDRLSDFVFYGIS